jgi:hypothetical protein
MSNLLNQFKFARNLLLKLQPVYIQPNRELRGKAPDVARTLKQRLEGTEMFVTGSDKNNFIRHFPIIFRNCFCGKGSQSSFQG